MRGSEIERLFTPKKCFTHICYTPKKCFSPTCWTPKKWFTPICFTPKKWFTHICFTPKKWFTSICFNPKKNDSHENDSLKHLRGEAIYYAVCPPPFEFSPTPLVKSLQKCLERCISLEALFVLDLGKWSKTHIFQKYMAKKSFFHQWFFKNRQKLALFKN